MLLDRVWNLEGADLVSASVIKCPAHQTLQKNLRALQANCVDVFRGPASFTRFFATMSPVLDLALVSEKVVSLDTFTRDGLLDWFVRNKVPSVNEKTFPKKLAAQLRECNEQLLQKLAEITNFAAAELLKFHRRRAEERIVRSASPMRGQAVGSAERRRIISDASSEGHDEDRKIRSGTGSYGPASSSGVGKQDARSRPYTSIGLTEANRRLVESVIPAGVLRAEASLARPADDAAPSRGNKSQPLLAATHSSQGTSNRSSAAAPSALPARERSRERRTSDQSDEELRRKRLLNEARASEGLPPLGADLPFSRSSRGGPRNNVLQHRTIPTQVTTPNRFSVHPPGGVVGDEEDPLGEAGMMEQQGTAAARRAASPVACGGPASPLQEGAVGEPMPPEQALSSYAGQQQPEEGRKANHDPAMQAAPSTRQDANHPAMQAASATQDAGNSAITPADPESPVPQYRPFDPQQFLRDRLLQTSVDQQAPLARPPASPAASGLAELPASHKNEEWREEDQVLPAGAGPAGAPPAAAALPTPIAMPSKEVSQHFHSVRSFFQKQNSKEHGEDSLLLEPSLARSRQPRRRSPVPRPQSRTRGKQAFDMGDFLRSMPPPQ